MEKLANDNVHWCEPLKLPFGYLGLLMGENMTRVKAWKCVVDKVTSKLSNWKAKTLSIDGRLTLLKSVLGETPTFLTEPEALWVRVVKAIHGLHGVNRGRLLVSH
ncbi:hypothetical protein Tco_0075328, partial [Tanacetum coccineum]